MAKRIVLTCWGSHGDLLPYIGLGRALSARGHDVVVATLELYREHVEREGLAFAAAGPAADPRDRALIARVMDPDKGSEIIIRELLLSKLRDHYAELERAAAGADLIVSHPVTFAAPLVAERLGLPWLSTTLAPMLFFSPTDLPVLPTAPRLTRQAWLPTVAARALVTLARAVSRPWMRPVHELRAELGLRPTGHPLFEAQFSPHGTLALFSRVLARPQPDWPPNVTITGAMLYNLPDTLPRELEDFLAAGPPPVVFTLGTSAVGAAGDFYRESAAAVRALGVRAVLLTGGFVENALDEPPSPDVLVIDRAQHALLLPRASAIVHHGGAGTTAQALGSGRPALVVPHSHDQFDNAERVRRLGVARTLYPQRYRAARVARELDALLRDARYGERAAATAAIVCAEDGAAAAAAAVERLLA